MKNAVVLYHSKYGSTKKYAQWVADTLSCDLFDAKAIKPEQLQNYDVIIYGGGVYSSGVSGIDLIIKSFETIKSKHIIVFSCGISDPTDDANTAPIKQSLNERLTQEMQESIKLFHVRGAIDYNKLSFLHKPLMKMLNIMLAKKDPATLSDQDKYMLSSYGKASDFTDKTMISPLVNYVQGL